MKGIIICSFFILLLWSTVIVDTSYAASKHKKSKNNNNNKSSNKKDTPVAAVPSAVPAPSTTIASTSSPQNSTTVSDPPKKQSLRSKLAHPKQNNVNDTTAVVKPGKPVTAAALLHAKIHPSANASATFRHRPLPLRLAGGGNHNGSTSHNNNSPALGHHSSAPPPPSSASSQQRFNGSAFMSNHAMVHVLLFGDSLTEGFYNHGQSFHSYGIRLQSLLSDLGNKTLTAAGGNVAIASPSPVLASTLSKKNGTTTINAFPPSSPLSFMSMKSFHVHSRGLSGETTPHMIQRLHQILQQELTNPQSSRTLGRRYDMVCILGGTNDLATATSNADVNKIFTNLQTMYSEVYRHNPEATLVLLTVPQSFVKDESYLQRRSQLNQLIQNFNGTQQVSMHMTRSSRMRIPRPTNTTATAAVASSMLNGIPMVHGSLPQQKVIHIDLEKAFPYYKADGKKDDRLWDDGLHFTVAGYNAMAELVYEHIKHNAKSHLLKHREEMLNGYQMVMNRTAAFRKKAPSPVPGSGSVPVPLRVANTTIPVTGKQPKDKKGNH